MPTMRKDHNRENPFVMINKEGIRDPRLSAKARGLWAFMLSFPDDWQFNMAYLERSFPDGKTAIDSGLKELSEMGYLLKLQFSGSGPGKGKGKGFQRNIWIFFESPMSQKDEKRVLQREIASNPGTIVKISSTRAGFTPALNATSPNVNTPIYNKDLLKNEETNICAPSLMDANTPSSSILSDAKNIKDPPPNKASPPQKNSVPQKKQMISRLHQHPYNEEFLQRFKVPIIATTEVQHDRMVEKHGLEKLIKGYAHLAMWKESIADSHPNSRVKLMQHTDYYRLNKWVMKEVLADNTHNPNIHPNGHQRRGKLAISADIRAKEEFVKPKQWSCTPEEEAEDEAYYQQMKKRNEEEAKVLAEEERIEQERVDEVRRKHANKLKENNNK